MTPQCRFGDGPAAVHIKLAKGCVCYPDDREQHLCMQHWYRSEPLGAVEVIAWL
jgi:hypothetical protein